MENKRRYRSLFWPVLLIGVGLVWLLANLNVIPSGTLDLLFSLWPLLLIALGLDLLFARNSPVIGAAIGLLTLLVIVGILVGAPVLGIKVPSSTVRVDHFTQPVGSTTSASFRLDSGSAPVKVTSLTGSTMLIDATIGHRGVMDFSVTGSGSKLITLQQTASINGFSFNPSDISKLRWDIGLAPNVPFDLNVDSGSGPVTLELAGLKLTGLTVNSGSGPVAVTLPESDKSYSADFTSGSGPVEVSLPVNTDLTVRTDSGSGPLTLKLPAGAALRVEAVDHGSGGLHLPSGLTQLSGDEKEGVWQTSGYDTAAHKIVIRITSAGSGPVNIR